MALKDYLQNVFEVFGFRMIRSNPGAITGVNFERDLRLLVKMAEPVYFDVGANRGDKIVEMQLALRNPKVYAFEPSVEAYAVLKSRPFARSINVYNFALGSSNRQMELLTYADSRLNSFLPLEPSEENRFASMPVRSKEVVETKTLDTFIKESGVPKIDLLKIDTQGFDLEVLRGGVEAFRSGLIANVLVEVNFVKMYQNQGIPWQILAFLSEHRMHLVDLYGKQRQGSTLAWCDALYTKR